MPPPPSRPTGSTPPAWRPSPKWAGALTYLQYPRPCPEIAANAHNRLRLMVRYSMHTAAAQIARPTSRRRPRLYRRERREPSSRGVAAPSSPRSGKTGGNPLPLTVAGRQARLARQAVPAPVAERAGRHLRAGACSRRAIRGRRAGVSETGSCHLTADLVPHLYSLRPTSRAADGCRVCPCRRAGRRRRIPATATQSAL
jgi:hypothetical protein